MCVCVCALKPGGLIGTRVAYWCRTCKCAVVNSINMGSRVRKAYSPNGVSFAVLWATLHVVFLNLSRACTNIVSLEGANGTP